MAYNFHFDPADLPPECEEDETLWEVEPGTPTEIWVYCFDPDTFGPLTYTIVDAPQHGTVAEGTVTYTSEAGYEGPDSFTVTAGDGLDESDPVTVHVTEPVPASSVAVEVNVAPSVPTSSSGAAVSASTSWLRMDARSGNELRSVVKVVIRSVRVVVRPSTVFCAAATARLPARFAATAASSAACAASTAVWSRATACWAVVTACWSDATVALAWSTSCWSCVAVACAAVSAVCADWSCAVTCAACSTLSGSPTRVASSAVSVLT